MRFGTATTPTEISGAMGTVYRARDVGEDREEDAG